MQAKMVDFTGKKKKKLKPMIKWLILKPMEIRKMHIYPNFQTTQSISDEAKDVHILQLKRAKGRHMLRRNGEGHGKASPLFVQKGSIHLFKV